MKNLNKFLLTLIILSLAFGQLLRFKFFDFLPSFYLHDLLLSLFLLINFQYLIHLPFNQFNQKTLLFLISLILFNPNYLLTLRLGLYLLSFLVLLDLDLDRNFLLKINFLAFLLVVVIGLFQYFFLPDLRILANLGWDDHLNRLTFPYLDPNFTGIVIALGFFFFWPISPWLALFLLLPLGLTYSRSAWLSWLLTLLLSFNKKTGLLMLSLLLIMIGLLPHRFGEGNNLLRKYSIKSRFQNDFHIAQQLIKHPFKGEFIPKYHTTTSLNRAGTANNSFLYIWQIGGILTLLSFLYWLFDLIKLSSQPTFWKLILIASFFNNVFFYPFIFVWFLILTGLTLRSPN